MNAAETQAFLARIGEPRLVRTKEIGPPDRGDTIDTYQGWQKRDRQVQEGARSFAPRRCTSVRYDGPVFSFHDTLPLGSANSPISRKLLPGEDDLPD